MSDVCNCNAAAATLNGAASRRAAPGRHGSPRRRRSAAARRCRAGTASAQAAKISSAGSRKTSRIRRGWAAWWPGWTAHGWRDAAQSTRSARGCGKSPASRAGRTARRASRSPGSDSQAPTAPMMAAATAEPMAAKRTLRPSRSPSFSWRDKASVSAATAGVSTAAADALQHLRGYTGPGARRAGDQHGCRHDGEQPRGRGGTLAGRPVHQHAARHLAGHRRHRAGAEREADVGAAPVLIGEVDGQEGAEPGLHQRGQEVQPAQRLQAGGAGNDPFAAFGGLGWAGRHLVLLAWRRPLGRRSRIGWVGYRLVHN